MKEKSELPNINWSPLYDRGIKDNITHVARTLERRLRVVEERVTELEKLCQTNKQDTI